MTQSELQLENKLIKQLTDLGYESVEIPDEKALESNLKSQLEKHNKTTFSAKEFEKILNHLGKGNIFERAKTLRDKMQLTRDNGSTSYIEFFDSIKRCKNRFQVTNQITIEGSYKNRYDVTILVNGLPLVQIELKRRGLELKEAFNQTNRYQRHSYNSGYGLFQYIQMFVISNGVNTKYYANNRKQSFKQTFYRSDEENKNITQLEEFTNEFLEPCHMSKMIAKYIVLNETDKILMILRPYQFYATEKILDRVANSNKNGYIWHTTGSGKTLTSFKASQLLTHAPDISKVIFVVDRKDLDYQTTKEFNAFSKGSVDGSNNTHHLVQQLADDNNKLIVTTIQKLNTAITKEHHTKLIDHLREEKIVFIFDECHRSQFGDTHDRIKKFFNNHQMFGFTGTPIFADNHNKNRTTADLFNECLHKYVITDAIKDENVLKFSIEYVGKYKEKENSQNNIDIQVEDIDTKELLESEDRLNKITDYIIANHDRKTHAKEFTAMFCVSSVDVLTKYYELFKSKKRGSSSLDKGRCPEDGGVGHNLKIATIFSYQANEEDKDTDGILDDVEIEVPESQVNKHSRDKLESYIQDYNQTFNTKFTTKDSKSFYNYYNDIAKRVKAKQIDILLVVNMFLTGFDSKTLNTMYVDKNLKYHGLIQAFSRTNRILNEKKSQGNIVCFRNLKETTDEAIALFSNKEAKETILMAPYEEYVEKFDEMLNQLFDIAPTVDSVNDLTDEEMELKFVQIFRELMRLKNTMAGFADFTFADLNMSEQMFEDYKSKYLDIHDKVKTNTDSEKVSILNDIDFELELIHRDEVNVAYILNLLSGLTEVAQGDREKHYKAILDMIAGEKQLRNKKELIQKFIDKNLANIENIGEIEPTFELFRDDEKKQALKKICEEEKLKPEKVDELIGNFLFTERKPLNEEIVSTLQSKPKLLERKAIIARVHDKIMNFVDTFINGMG
ncbi:MAG TPA: type I restriction endonuclease subunit R [Candidatus Absconditabacterales bacterium]|nr:type I restriction endonuclease subunit R [Candidatus Absconditabacterales bacterium]